MRSLVVNGQSASSKASAPTPTMFATLNNMQFSGSEWGGQSWAFLGLYWLPSLWCEGVTSRIQSCLSHHVGTGILYDDYKSPMYPNALAKPTSTAPMLNTAHAQRYLDMELYRIFYPGVNDRDKLCNRAANPWLVSGCP
jgi:hypothetical protein